jgi:hypothetical protein
MLLTLSALMASAVLNFSSPSAKAAVEIQAPIASCQCACCKGGVCKCGMHKLARAAKSCVPSARPSHESRQVDAAGCDCSDSNPVSRPQSNDLISAGTGADGELHLAQLSAAAWSTSDPEFLRLPVTGVFDPSPPDSFRSIPLRI